VSPSLRHAFSVRYLVTSFLNRPAATEIYTLSLHDALPILGQNLQGGDISARSAEKKEIVTTSRCMAPLARMSHMSGFIALVLGEIESTRLNSSHVKISYAVFCLKKKRKKPRNE